MSQPEPSPTPVAEPLRVLCPECGTIIEVADPSALIRAMHLMRDCSVSSLLSGAQE